MSCLHEQVNALVVYGNMPPQKQAVYGIRYINPRSGAWIKGHKSLPACYIGRTLDARSFSHTEVYALNNFGAFYTWWPWLEIVKYQQQRKETNHDTENT